jgi:hypothetical protein
LLHSIEPTELNSTRDKVAHGGGNIRYGPSEDGMYCRLKLVGFSDPQHPPIKVKYKCEGFIRYQLQPKHIFIKGAGDCGVRRGKE